MMYYPRQRRLIHKQIPSTIEQLGVELPITSMRKKNDNSSTIYPIISLFAIHLFLKVPKATFALRRESSVSSIEVQ